MLNGIQKMGILFHAIAITAISIALRTTRLTILDKFKLHGAPYIEHLTGGSALHMNLEEHLSEPQYRQLLRVAAQEGCNYFTFQTFQIQSATTAVT